MKKLSKGCLIAIGVLVVGIICLAVASVLFSGEVTMQQALAEKTAASVDPTTVQTEEVSQRSEEVPTSAPEIEEVKPTEPSPTAEQPAEEMIDTGPTFEEICANSTTGGQTELVWDTFKKENEGKFFVNRLGVVDNVSEGLFGGYSLNIDVGNSFGSCAVRVVIGVSEEESLKIKVGEEILFSGKISSMAEFFSDVSIHLDEGTYNLDPEAVAAAAEAQRPPMGEIGAEYACGNSFLITVLEQPEYLTALGYGNTALGKYLVLKLQVVNNTGETVDGFQDDNFTIEGRLSNNPVKFSANWDPSWYAANRQYGYKSMGEELPPGLPWKTQVVFDVNPEATGLVFLFAPKDNMFDSNNLCEVRVAVGDVPK